MSCQLRRMMARLVCAGTTLLLAVLVPTTAAAQYGHRLEITPVVGGAINFSELADRFDTDEGVEGRVGVDDAFVYGIHLGIRLVRGLSVELSSLLVPTRIAARAGALTVGQDTDIQLLNGSLMYSFGDAGERFRPFVAAGGGVKSYEEGPNDASFNVGGGIRLRLGARTGLRFEVRDYMSSWSAPLPGENRRFQHDVMVTTGVSFGFF